MRYRSCSSTRDTIKCGRCATDRQSWSSGGAICVSGSWQRIYCASQCSCRAQNTLQLCNFIEVDLFQEHKTYLTRGCWPGMHKKTPATSLVFPTNLWYTSLHGLVYESHLLILSVDKVFFLHLC